MQLRIKDTPKNKANTSKGALMYVSATECAAQKYCELHGIAVPEVRSFADLHHFFNKSKYAVERAFNDLPMEEREILKALADIEDEDLTDPFLSGNQLSHYTKEGQCKLAKGLRLMRTISNRFPKMVCIADFYRIDRQIKRTA